MLFVKTKSPSNCTSRVHLNFNNWVMLVMICYIFQRFPDNETIFSRKSKTFHGFLFCSIHRLWFSFFVFLFFQIISFEDELSLVSPSDHSNKNFRINLFICFLLHTCCATISRNFSGSELYGSTNQFSPFTLVVILNSESALILSTQSRKEFSCMFKLQ